MAASISGSTSVFQLEGVAEPGLDLFGVWAEAEPSPPVSFATNPGTGPWPVWRVRLSGQVETDATALTGADRALDVASHALETVLPRLEVVRQQTEVGGVYSLGRADGPEARLSALLHGSQTSTDEVVFGIGGWASSWSGVVNDFRGIVRTSSRMLVYPAWVESFAGDVPLGRTIATWTGEQVSIWPSTVSPDQVRAHQRALDLAIHTRATFIRMVAIVARAAALLMRATTPLGPVVALPAAWKFAHDVVRELRPQKEPR